MNFLFLTTMMILIFTLVSTSMTKNLRTSTLIANQLEQQMEKSYNYLNAKEKKKYTNSKKRTKKTNATRAKNRVGKEYHPRKNCLGENSKLNLYHYAHGKLNYNEEILIQKTVENLFADLYHPENLFGSKESMKRFSRVFLAGLKKSGSLAKVAFSSQKDRELYLILCNGKNKQKLPSLLNHLTIQKVEKEAFLVFPYLSPPILRALFGNDLALSILKKEKEKYYEGKAIARLGAKDFENIIFDTKFDTHKNLITHKPFRFKNTQAHIASEMGSLFIIGPPDTPSKQL